VVQRTHVASPVAPLRAFGREDLARAGGKGANLGELARSAFPVPDGFVVTTDAYTAAVDSAGLAPLIAERLAADDDATIRDEFATVAVPQDTRRAIVDAYAQLGATAVAVRSSATAEDLPGAAFAGQQDTYLNVVGEEAVIDAVRRCWGSLWTERAIAYRRRLDIDPAEVRIAVVVQRMVDADSAGVLFTANPITGDRRQIVIEASSGFGEAVVAGLVTPDRYVLDAGGTVRSWSPGRREVVIRGATGGGVARTSGEPETVRRLPGHVLAELARLGSAAATHFGRPQDIEWAYADGRVHLLQARPMTAVPPPPVRLNRVQRLLGSILLEYLPVRPYPMDMTTWLPHGPAGLMAELARSIGIEGAFEDFIREEDGVAYQLVPRSPRPTPRLLLAPFRLASRARRHHPDRWTQDPRFTAFLRRVRALADRDLVALSWPELVQVPRQTLDLVKPVTALRIDYLPRAGLWLLRLLVTLALLGRTRLMRDLVLGAPTRTAAANRALETLAAQVRGDPGLVAAIETLDADRIRPFGAFHDALRAFLSEYGHRETVSPILVSTPTWDDSVETVLGVIRMLAARPPTTNAAADPAARALELLLAHPLLRRKTLRARMVRWVQAARSGVAFREDTHFYFTKPLPILRRCLLEIGRRLRDAGVLATPQDVFHLRLEEVEGIADVAALTGRQGQRLRAAVRVRSARRQELSGVRLVDPRLVFPQRDTGDALVSGAPAGGGTATGPVRVIRDPAEFARLRGGDVLVCPYTNPAWTPVFQRVAAVVVDTGGIGSHAAIVAREYGIPAIMGTVSGTADLADGQLVTVDGDTGHVTAAGDA
jgi:rifampicin phosphotransferase